MDSDGDIDVVSASGGDNKIAWYENDGASDPSFSANTSPPPLMVRLVLCLLMSIAMAIWILFPHRISDDKIRWYENNNGHDPSWTARTITTSADRPYSVPLTLDNDGDMDIVSASNDDDRSPGMKTMALQTLLYRPHH